MRACLYLGVVAFSHALLRAPRHPPIHLVPRQEAKARHQGCWRPRPRGRGGRTSLIYNWKGGGGYSSVYRVYRKTVEGPNLWQVNLLFLVS